MQEDEITEQYTKKEDIEKIIFFIKEKEIIKTEHFIMRILQRDIPENVIDDNLYATEKIKMIDKREHNGKIGYDCYYELSNSQTLKLCFIPLKDKVMLVNAFLRNRKWQNSIRFVKNRN